MLSSDNGSFFFRNHRLFLVSLFLTVLGLNVLLLRQVATRLSQQGDSADVAGAQGMELLPSPLIFSGNKVFSSKAFFLPSFSRSSYDTLVVTYDLHGLCLLKGKSSEIALLDGQGRVHSTHLSEYGEPCKDGIQHASIPLSNFSGLSQDTVLSSLAFSFWYPTSYFVEIESVFVYNTSKGSTLGLSTRLDQIRRRIRTATPTRTVRPTRLVLPTRTRTITPSPVSFVPSLQITMTPTAVPTTAIPVSQSWGIQSVSSMKETKDRVCGPRDPAYIEQWVQRARLLGANYVAIETPYDNPACGDSLAYTKLWVSVVRAHGLSVWHRHMPLAFEGIYNTPKNKSADYLAQISAYIKENSSLFASGDIFTPIPEPQNGGISGVTYCSEGTCMFNGAGHFNQWLRDAITISDLSFAGIGLGGKIKIGYFGFDGFVAWGDNNPDWEGILEDETIKKMGNITIDHYPEAVGDTMEHDLDELMARYPGIPIIIGEWGTITGGDIQGQVLKSMQAAKRPGVVGFNYWHMGMGGNESIIGDDFSAKAQYDEVQRFYTGIN